MSGHANYALSLDENLKHLAARFPKGRAKTIVKRFSRGRVLRTALSVTPEQHDATDKVLNGLQRYDAAVDHVANGFQPNPNVFDRRDEMLAKCIDVLGRRFRWNTIE